MDKPKLGIVPIPFLLAVLAIILVTGSITVLGSSKEKGGRSFENLCLQYPNHPDCQPRQVSSPPPPEMCSKVVDGVSVSFPCELPQTNQEPPPLPR